MKRGAIVLYAAGDADADLYYATRFSTPDPYLFVQAGRRKIMVVGDLELDRARARATVSQVRRIGDVERRLRAGGRKGGGTADVTASILRELRVKRAVVPAHFPVSLADQLRARGIRVDPGGELWPERRVKTRDEVRAIEEAQAGVEYAVDKAVDALRRSRAKGDRLMLEGQALTSESLRRIIHVALLERDCVARETIVACGDQGCEPHQRGTGPLRPNQTIVMDVFPRSSTTQYYADMSRTVVKGRASAGARRLFDAVLDAQEHGIARVKPGVDGRDVHVAVQERLKQLGFKTGMRNGRMEGYFHGTGHGVGLDLHEAPWLTGRGGTLEEGAVVTVEPGLYYRGVGAVRLEDMVLVTKGGCRNLTKYPKFLEV